MRTRLRRIVPGVLAAALLAAILPWGVPAHRDLLDTALTMRVLPMDERRRSAFGSWYRAAEELRLATAPRTPIDLVMATPQDSNLGLQTAGALYLRDCRLYWGWDAWRRRERADFLPGAHAVNAAPGPPPGPAAFVVYLDAKAARPFRIVTPPPQ